MNTCTVTQHRLAIYAATINGTWCDCLAVLLEGWHTTRTPTGQVLHRCRCHPAGMAHKSENEGASHV